MQNVKVSNVEKKICNKTTRILSKSNLSKEEMDLAKIGLINGILTGYMHKSSSDSYSLIDISYREVKMMAEDIKKHVCS